MRRRDLLAGAAALGIFGVGAASTFGDGLPGTTSGSEEQSPGTVGATVDPVTLPAIDAPGSPPGERTVPERGRVTFVEMFATWCTTCQASMSELRAAHERADDVQFVSVNIEPVGETVEKADVTEWWVEYEGSWPVTYDAELELTRRLDATEVPFAAVLDAENTIQWTGRGYKEADTIVAEIEAAQ